MSPWPAERFQQIIRNGCGTNGEYCFVRKNGSRFYMAVHAVRIGADRVIGFCVDVTERRDAEQSLREHAEALQKANATLEEMCEKAEAAAKAKSQFLANMSHEFRTPMTAILGYANVLLDYAHEDVTIESAQIIKRNGEHLLSVINDVLDLSRIEAGKEKIEITACSPRQVAADVVSLMKARADAKGLELLLETKARSPQRFKAIPRGCGKSSSTSSATPSSSPTRGRVRLAMRVENVPGTCLENPRACRENGHPNPSLEDVPGRPPA